MEIDKETAKLIKKNEDIHDENVKKFKDAYKNYLADDSQFNWDRWNKLRQVMFALGKTPDEVISLMDEIENQ